MNSMRRRSRRTLATVAMGVVVLGSGALVTSASAQSVGRASPPKVTLSGKVSDGSGHGWPLYASITVQGGSGGPSGPVFTNPFTGRYQVRLPGARTWNLTVEPVYPGYVTTTTSVPLGTHNVVSNISVAVDDTSCSAPGYQLGATSCDPVPGGLLAGLTRDAVANKPLPGVAVASNDVPTDTSTSAATPNDPSLADGFYWLFSSVTGSHSFTATRQHYATRTHNVNVHVDAVTRQDFALGAGRLKVSPGALSASVRLGHSAARTLTLRNTGTSPLHVSLIAQDGGLQLAAVPTVQANAIATGAQVRHVRGHYSPLRQAGRSKTTAQHAVAHPAAPSRAMSHEVSASGTAVLPAATSWAAITDYPTAVQDNAAAYFDGKLYSVGGFDGTGDLASLYVYDPGTAAWTQLADMSTTREVPQAAWINGKLYVTGGWGPNGDPDGATEAYDPSTNSWTALATNPDPFAAASRGIVLDGKLYTIGGCSASSCGSSDVQVYDPTTDSWSPGPAYPEPISWESCGTISGQIYCAGGTTDAGTSTSTYSFDGTTWTQQADMPVDDWGGYYAAANGQLLVSSGVINGSSLVTNESWSYDPATDQWSSLPASNTADYRGSGACGLYKVGGNPGGLFAPPVPTSEVLPGFDACDTDVAWLSETPTSINLAPGASRTVAVRLDSAPLAQPGTYLARIAFPTNTPYSVNPVKVSFHVNP